MEPEELDEISYSIATKCFLCGHVFIETEEPWYIFHKQKCGDESEEFSMAAKLSEILEQDVNEEVAHSSFLCEICNSNLLEYESIERRLHSLRDNIKENYISALASNKIEDCNEIVNYIECNDEIKIQNEYLRYSQESLEFSAIIEEDISSNNDLNTPMENVPEEQNQFDIEQLEIPIPDKDKPVEIKEDNVNCNKSEEITPNDSNDNNLCAEYFQYIRNIYRCELCPAAFRNLKHIVGHLREKHSKSIYYCELCQKVFKCQNQLILHIQQEQHHQHNYKSNEELSYECLACELKFINYREFCHHRRKKHGNKHSKNYECLECKKLFSSQYILNTHMNTHSGERPYKCQKCSKDFVSKYALQVHTKTHTERKRSYQCNKCDKTFYNKQNLVNHKKLHAAIKNFNCDECDKSFKLQSSLDVHKKIHKDLKPFQCHTCGKGFIRKCEVRDHERTHTGEKPFHCDLCPMAFAQRSNLTAHKKYTHLKEALHKCTQCERSFKRRRLLDYHVQAVHTGERPHKCAICGMGFVYPEHFKKHMRKHTGQTPYACEVCGKQFKSSDNRNTHRFVHSEKKPYECMKCGAGFMRKPQLLVHMTNMGHNADTIIVNQPQIKTATETDVNYVAQEFHQGQEEQSMIDEEISERIDYESGNLDTINENNIDNVNDVIIVDDNFLKDNLVGKFLQFDDVENEDQSTITWVDIEDEKH